MIPRSAYYEPAVLDDELSRLFSGQYQFAALTTELENDRDFVCVDHQGASVVVQNFKGELRAFLNVCTHRFSPLQTEERGNRVLTCRYHGWSFDKTGYPVGMPKRESFAFDDDREKLCLTRYHVETCGKFVFFRRGGGDETLRDYLGGFYDLLETIGGYFGPEIDYGTTPHAANWKLLVENVLECYHCSVVHPVTFGKTLGIGRAPIADVKVDGPHSSSHFPKTEIKDEKRRQKALAYLDRREFVHSSFFHIYIFPNLFISSAEGVSFYVGHALPTSAAETQLRFRLFGPRLELTRGQKATQDFVDQNSGTLGRAVIEEDRVILEAVQRGVRLADKDGVIGRDEVRIAEFVTAYETLMRGEALPRAATAPLLGGVAAVDDHVGPGDPARRVA